MEPERAECWGCHLLALSGNEPPPAPVFKTELSASIGLQRRCPNSQRHAYHTCEKGQKIKPVNVIHTSNIQDDEEDMDDDDIEGAVHVIHAMQPGGHP
ncbi:hypothetical protein NDU88_006235 [Pleurodeles waltl]|uniref:Uncharacterized protein n=1 Tax=Pleurodeles waltl TaxID=8319 RepID=A0AAV7VP99_PLEWA|nr:hypothetical protein NDU88_006235 [Pleurodeles waltl]